MWRKTFEHKDTVTPTYAYLQYVDVQKCWTNISSKKIYIFRIWENSWKLKIRADFERPYFWQTSDMARH